VNAFDFVLGLVIVLILSRIVMHKMGIPARSMREMRDGTSSDTENARLRGQVQQLQERMKVLERIVTDRGADTAAQIEALRERDKIAEEDKD
jgi:hypothetical protein